MVEGRYLHFSVRVVISELEIRNDALGLVIILGVEFTALGVEAGHLYAVAHRLDGEGKGTGQGLSDDLLKIM